MEELLQQVGEVFTMIFEQKIQVPQKVKQNINSQIGNFIQTLNHDEQKKVSESFIRTANRRIKNYIQKQILPQFLGDCDSEEKIEKFLYLQKMYVKSINSIITVIYQTAYCLEQENVPQFFSHLFDIVFVEELQSSFENILFNCVIDLIEKASKSKDENYINGIGEKLKKFGDIMTQLYKSTEEALPFKIELAFKQKIYDYYEELYQNYHKNWKAHLLTQQYLEEVSNQKAINSKVLQFNDKTILQQVNKILNSHLLTQYKSQLLNVNGVDNFEGYLINYHSDPDRYSKVLTQIGDLYGSLEDHYDQLTNNFKNLIVKEGQNIMRQKNKQIVENNQDQKFSDPKFIQSFYDLYQKYYQLIERCFSLKSDFIMALNNAFETFINCPIGNHEFADYLVVYIGEQIEYLRTQSKIAIQQYEHIIRLFVFINQKQRFIKLYKIYLAQRLIRYQRQVDNKKNKAACLIESNVVEEMEKKCGTQDLESLKSMIKDYDKIVIENYKKQDTNGISLLIQKPIILQKQFWPEIDEIQIDLPCDLIQQQKEEIASQHSQKTLIWLDLISSVEVQTDKQITLNISVPQCAILFLYQYDNIPLDLQTISSRTNLHLSYVTQNCKIMKDFKILEEQIKDNTIYYFYNENSTKKKGGKQQKKITTDTYFQTVQIEQVVSIQDQDLAIEAAIVKLMKKNKEMQFSDLVIQVQGHMKTHQNIEISFSQIKLMIEKLQRNEYLERDSTNIQLIKYK